MPSWDFLSDFPAITSSGGYWAAQIPEITFKIATPKVKRIIYNNPATIVFWTDGTKTVVKCMKDQPYSEYYGFLCALGKKIYGSNSALNRLIDSFKEEKEDA